MAEYGDEKIFNYELTKYGRSNNDYSIESGHFLLTNEEIKTSGNRIKPPVVKTAEEIEGSASITRQPSSRPNCFISLGNLQNQWSAN